MFGILSGLPETNQGINGIWNTRKGKYSDIWGLGTLFSVADSYFLRGGVVGADRQGIVPQREHYSFATLPTSFAVR